MAKDLLLIKRKIKEIKEETGKGKNTATRIGSVLDDLLELISTNDNEPVPPSLPCIIPLSKFRFAVDVNPLNFSGTNTNVVTIRDIVFGLHDRSREDDLNGEWLEEYVYGTNYIPLLFVFDQVHYIQIKKSADSNWEDLFYDCGNQITNKFIIACNGCGDFLICSHNNVDFRPLLVKAYDMQFFVNDEYSEGRSIHIAYYTIMWINNSNVTVI